MHFACLGKRLFPGVFSFVLHCVGFGCNCVVLCVVESGGNHGVDERIPGKFFDFWLTV